METPPPLSRLVFGNPLILQKIFSFLPSPTLLITRLVSHTFSSHALSHLSPASVHIHVQSFSPSKAHPPCLPLPEMSSLLTHTPLRHTLSLSLCPEPWLSDRATPSEENTSKFKTYSGHHGNPPHRSPDLFRYLAETGSLVSYLRLEALLGNEEDARFLSILRDFSTLTSLYLDIVSYKAEGLSHFVLPPTQESITTLGLRFHSNSISSPNLTTSSFTPIWSSFRSSTTLDLSSWSRSRFVNQETKAWELFLKAGATLSTKITCLWADYLSWECCRDFWGPLTLFCSVTLITELNLFVFGAYRDLERLRDLIHGLRETLTVLKFSWAPSECSCGEDIGRRIRLPSLPKLNRLILATVTDLEGDRDQITFAEEDVLSLRDIFLDGATSFHTSFPALTHLCLPFMKDLGPNFWEYLIPNRDKFAEELILPQIKVLEITQSSSCDDSSLTLTRLFSIFPELRRFRHVRFNDKDLCVGCEHDFGRDAVFPFPVQEFFIPNFPRYLTTDPFWSDVNYDVNSEDWELQIKKKAEEEAKTEPEQE